MKEFDNMISGWKNQTIPASANKANDIANLAQKRLKETERKHAATIAVLGTTLLILTAFAIYTGGKSSLFMAGIGLMIAALGARIAVEWWSSVQLKKLNIREDSSNYLKQLTGFYQTRKKIHSIFTVITFGLYVVGFGMLLPLFKASLSSGFFIYIIVSGVIVFGVLIYFIRKKINEELMNLSLTINELSSIAESFGE
jgi:hypothetical protein